VVVGETSIIGERVRLYQGVTLGGEPFAIGQAHAGTPGERRHPRIGDDVVIFAGATIIGAITISARSRIAGNVWLRENVPPGSLVEPAAASVHPLLQAAFGSSLYPGRSPKSRLSDDKEKALRQILPIE
jgi:serine O-acetyltransferase